VEFGHFASLSSRRSVHCTLRIAHCSLEIGSGLAPARSGLVRSVLGELPSILRSSIHSWIRGSICCPGTSLNSTNNSSHPLVPAFPSPRCPTYGQNLTTVQRTPWRSQGLSLNIAGEAGKPHSQMSNVQYAMSNVQSRRRAQRAWLRHVQTPALSSRSGRRGSSADR
jgi:hypothetical protein